MKKLIHGKALALAAMVLVLGACSETMEPVDDHPEAEGVQLIMGGNVIASYDGDTQMWTGELEVDAGEETPRIMVVFVDHEGNPVELEEDTYLEVDIGDIAIAEFEQATPGEFGGSLRGHMGGETDVSFKLMHGSVGSGHPDFVTQPVRAQVHEQEG